MLIKGLGSLVGAGLLALAGPALANDDNGNFENQFDKTLGTEQRVPQPLQAVYASGFEQQIAQIAAGGQGRIGVAAVDLSSGRSLSVLGDQLFPMASTSKIAIAATFLEGVEKGRWSLSSEFPLLIPRPSARFSSKIAPVSEGQYMSAHQLIELMITRSSNPATDALLRVVGGPRAVNDWVRRQGIRGFSLDRDIATLVRDDGEINPAFQIDPRDAATPKAMVELLAGLYQGKYLGAESRQVILGAMSRTKTGTRRIRGLMPANVRVSHKTGTLNNTASDIGIIETADGRALAVAIYVTGQGSKPARDAKIAEIARAIHDGYQAQSPVRNWTSASYPANK